MIDENEDYLTKSKLTITVKTFSKYNDRNRLVVKQTNKQTQRYRKQEKCVQKKKHTNRHRSRLAVDKGTQRG